MQKNEDSGIRIILGDGKWVSPAEYEPPKEDSTTGDGDTKVPSFEEHAAPAVRVRSRFAGSPGRLAAKDARQS